MKINSPSMHFLLLVIITVFFSIGAYPQNAKPTPVEEVIRVDTELIDVPLSVLDKNGRPLLDLKRTNFTVFEDNKPQEIVDFASTSSPFEVALLLDTSGSTRGGLELIRRSAQLFIDSLRPGDRVAIIAFKSERASAATTNILSPLTDDRSALRKALLDLSVSNGTPFYDSLVEIMTQVFDSEPQKQFRGRRSLVALTDGVDSTSTADISEAKELLQAAGIVNYFIKVDTREYFENDLLGDCESSIRFSMAQIRRYYRVTGAGRGERVSNFCQLGDFERLAVSKALYELADREMAELARTSGGQVFPVGDLNEARTAFRSVAAQIGTNYSLGYYSSNERNDGKFRSIRVELRGLPAGATVRAREGYVAPSK